MVFPYQIVSMAHYMPANHDPGGPRSGSLADALYKELWSACAGPLVKLPREGERASHKDTWSSLNTYLEAQSYRLSAGMKFQMRFEGEEVLEERSHCSSRSRKLQESDNVPEVLLCLDRIAK